MRSRLLHALIFVALTLAAALAAAPQLHESLHELGSHTLPHECAATLLTSGSVEHFESGPVSAAPQPAPATSAFRAELLPRVVAFLEFTRLEHAPPLFA